MIAMMTQLDASGLASNFRVKVYQVIHFQVQVVCPRFYYNAPPAYRKNPGYIYQCSINKYVVKVSYCMGILGGKQLCAHM